MAAYGFTTPRCDRRRYSCEAARLLCRSDAAQLKCNHALKQYDRIDVSELLRLHECWVWRDYGRRIQQRRHQNQTYETEICICRQVATLVQPRLRRKKAGIAAGVRASVSIHLVFTPRSTNAPASQAHCIGAQLRVAQSIATTARPAIRQKRPAKSSGHHKGRRLLDQQQRRAQRKQRCSTPSHRNRRD